MKSVVFLLMMVVSLIGGVLLMRFGDVNAEGSFWYEVLNPKGTFSYITLSVITFSLGTLSLIVIEHINQGRRKKQLLGMFLTDIMETWQEINSLSFHPSEKVFARIKVGFMGIPDIPFHGVPELKFEVHNLNFYETKGYELAEMLGAKAREKFWHVYQVIRRTESVRRYLLDNDEVSEDYKSYRKLFVELLTLLGNEILALEVELQKEKSMFNKLYYRLRK